MKPILGKLDFYIIKRFLGTYFFSIAIIISIAVVFDIQEKIEDFIENKAPLYEIVVHYYLNFIPYFANLFSSLFVFVAVIFFTSKMAFDTEIIAIQASGISFNRFLRPYFAAAALIALLSLVLIMYIIPESNKVRLDFEDKYVRGMFINRERDIHRQVRPGIFIYMESYNSRSDIGYRFSMESFDNGELRSKLVSEYVKWDAEKETWSVHNYYIRNYDGLHESFVKGSQVDTSFFLLPKDFRRRTIEMEKMNIMELNEFIDEQQLQGAENVEVYLIQKYQRWAYPFSTFILTVMGVCIANRKRRGGIGVNIAIGLLLSFTYILFMQVSTTFSTNSDVPAVVSVWIPNIFYSILCLFLYKNAGRI
jgi:lipopolysaccharide export system permease protein